MAGRLLIWPTFPPRCSFASSHVPAPGIPSTTSNSYTRPCFLKYLDAENLLFLRDHVLVKGLRGSAVQWQRPEILSVCPVTGRTSCSDITPTSSIWLSDQRTAGPD